MSSDNIVVVNAFRLHAIEVVQCSNGWLTVCVLEE